MWEAQYDKKMLRQFFINIERREENSALAKKLSAKRIIDLYKFYKARKIYYDKLKVIRENNNLKKKKKASSVKRRRSSIYSINSNFDYSKRVSVRKNRRSSQFSNNEFSRSNIKKNSNASSITKDFKINLIHMESNTSKKNDKDIDIHNSSFNTNSVNQSKINNHSNDNKNNENS